MPVQKSQSDTFYDLPVKIQLLLPDGNWKETFFTEQDGKYRLPVRLDCAEIAVFRIFVSTPIR